MGKSHRRCLDPTILVCGEGGIGSACRGDFEGSAYLYPGVVVAERVGWEYRAESMYVDQSEVDKCSWPGIRPFNTGSTGTSSIPRHPYSPH